MSNNISINLLGDSSSADKALKSVEKSLIAFLSQLKSEGRSIDVTNAKLGALIQQYSRLGSERGNVARKLIQESKQFTAVLGAENEALGKSPVNQRNYLANSIQTIKAKQQEKRAIEENVRALEQEIRAKQSAMMQQIAPQGVLGMSQGVPREAGTASLAAAFQNLELEKATRMAADAQKQLDAELRQVTNALYIAQNGLLQFGTSMTFGFTVPIVAAGAKAVQTFANMEKGTVNIQRSAEITRESADRITQAFIDISREVPLTVEELQKAGFAAAQAGIVGEEAIINFAKAAAMLSKVGGDAFNDMPVEKLADNVAKLSIAFGININDWEEVNKVASLFLGVAKDIPGGLTELMSGLRRVAGPAQTLGVELDTVTALMGALIASGEPAERAGTQLATVFRQVVTEFEDVSKVLGLTGDELDGLQKRMDTDFGGVILELIDRISQIPSATERAEVSLQLFSTVGARAFLPLINGTENLVSVLERARTEFGDGTLLLREFEIQSNSLSGTIQVFQNNVLALAKAVGDDLAPIVNVFLKNATVAVGGLIDAWINLNPLVKGAVVLFAGMLAVIGPLALILNTLFLAPLAGMARFAIAMRTIFTLTAAQTFATNLQAIATFNLGTAIVGAVTAMKAWAATIATAAIPAIVAWLPYIFLVVGAIGALVAAMRALGVSIKMPSFNMPKLPEAGAAGPTGLSKTAEQMQEELQAEEEARERLTKAQQKAAEDRQKELEKEIKARKRLLDDELRAIEDSIREFEKVRKEEIRVLQRSVQDQRDIIDIRKDLWDQERSAEEEKIDAQRQVLKVVRDSLDEAKKTLQGIKKAQQGELDVVEGRVDIAKMNLNAAQNALRREQILGRDEYDASFRAAKERVKSAEEALTLAQENVIRVKREYQEQIKAQEEIVDATQEQVDVQQDALDDLGNALAERKKIVDSEVKILGDELKIRQRALSDYQSTTQEKLDILREDRDNVKRAGDDELRLLQDKLDAIREQNQAIRDMSLGAAPDATGMFDEKQLSDALTKELRDALSGVSDISAGSFSMGGLEIDQQGPLGKFIENARKGFEDLGYMAQEEGRSAGSLFLEAWIQTAKELPQMIVDGIFGDGTWDNFVNTTIVQETLRFSNAFWEGTRTGFGGVFGGFLGLLRELLFPGKTWSEVRNETRKKGVEVATSLGDGIRSMWANTMDSFRNIIGSVGSAYEGMRNSVLNFGRNLGNSLADGIYSTWSRVQDAFRNISGAVGSAVSGMIGTVAAWGKNLGESLASGIYQSWEALKRAGEWAGNFLGNFWKGFSPPKQGPLSEIDTWGKNLIKTFGDGMTIGISDLKGDVDSINAVIAASLGDVDMALSPVSAGVSSSLSGGSSQSVMRSLDSRGGAAAQASQTNQSNKNYYIQPGQMIASRGEIRNFVRMLKEYEDSEAQR